MRLWSTQRGLKPRFALPVVAAVGALVAIVAATHAEDLGYDDGFAEALLAAEAEEDHVGAEATSPVAQAHDIVGAPERDEAAVAASQPPSGALPEPQEPGE